MSSSIPSAAAPGRLPKRPSRSRSAPAGSGSTAPVPSPGPYRPALSAGLEPSRSSAAALLLSPSIHLLPQHRRNVVVVHVRPVGAEAVGVVAADVGDGLAVEGHVGGRLLLLLALGLRRRGERRCRNGHRTAGDDRRRRRDARAVV